jgi:hypothetical protein
LGKIKIVQVEVDSCKNCVLAEWDRDFCNVHCKANDMKNLGEPRFMDDGFIDKDCPFPDQK